MDKGRSTGVGYVRFSNEGDAQRAISILYLFINLRKCKSSIGQFSPFKAVLRMKKLNDVIH